MALLTQKNVGGVTVTPGVATAFDQFIVENTYPSGHLRSPLTTVGLPRIQIYINSFPNTYNGVFVRPPSASFFCQVQLAFSTSNGEPLFRTFDEIQVPPSTGINISYEQPCLAVRLFFRGPFGDSTIGWGIQSNVSAFGP